MNNADSGPDGMSTLNRSIELLLKLKIHEIKGDRSQSEMIYFGHLRVQIGGNHSAARGNCRYRATNTFSWAQEKKG